MNTNIKKSNKKGFTIIEVMIVLAIAGLILAIIFLAVPALQRNSRNNSRRNDVAHLSGLVNEFVSNHQGQLPTGVCNTAASCTANPTFLDVTTENWAIITAPVSADIVTNAANYGSTTNAKIDKGTTCSGGTITTGASTNAFSVGFQVEASGGPQNTCIQG